MEFAKIHVPPVLKAESMRFRFLLMCETEVEKSRGDVKNIATEIDSEPVLVVVLELEYRIDGKWKVLMW